MQAPAAPCAPATHTQQRRGSAQCHLFSPRLRRRQVKHIPLNEIAVFIACPSGQGMCFMISCTYNTAIWLDNPKPLHLLFQL